MLYFWHTLLVLRCFSTVSLSVKVQYSNWMLLAARGDIEDEASFCWQQRIGVLSSTSKLLCLSFNHWISPNLTSAHADCILFRPLKLGWSTQVCARHPQSRGRYLRPACNSHPFRSDAKVQLNLPGYRAKNSGSLLEINCSLTHLFVLPSTSQLLSSECHFHDSPCSAQCPKYKIKARYVVSSRVYLLIVGMKCQKNLRYFISLFCFLHRRSNQIAWSAVIVFPPSWLPLMTCRPQSGSAFERILQSRWILSGSLASCTLPTQRQRCCTFSKNLNSFASLAGIFQFGAAVL